MALDANLILSDDQDLSQVIGAYLSDKSVDLWNGARQTTAKGNTPVMDPGMGNHVLVVCQVTESFVGATATVNGELIMADDEALTSNVVVLQQAPGGSVTVGIPVATLVAGYQFRIGGTIPPGVSKRYLGVRYNIFTATTTSGKITAFLTRNWATPPGVFK
jgi:hypothetical protein